MFWNSWFKKEAPFQGLTGFGGGATNLQVSSSADKGVLEIYAWGAVGKCKGYPDGNSNTNFRGGGYTEVSIQKSSIPTSYTKLEIIVGQSGGSSDGDSDQFGGGGRGTNNGGKGTPGAGCSGAWLTSPTHTNVWDSPGKTLSVPQPEADSRCIMVAGGSGGRDSGDGSGGCGGGGVSVPPHGGPPGTQANVARTGGGPGNPYKYIGGNADAPGPWGSGGGGGGYQAGNASYDFDGGGGCGFIGSTSTSDNPFEGPSPVNSLEYGGAGGFVAYSVGSPNQTPYPTAQYSIPNNGSGPTVQNAPTSGYIYDNGYVVVIDNGVTTAYPYNGAIQFHTLS